MPAGRVAAGDATPAPAALAPAAPVGLPRAETRGRIAFLDTLRFVAAAAVLAQHLLEGQHGRLTDGLVGLGPGVFGVALFFIISGFVIPFSVKRGFDPAGFAIRRLCRIYPLALVAFAAAYLAGASGLIPAYGPAGNGSAAAWIANLLLVNDYVGAPAFHGVTWTLSIELAWYALFAAMLMAFGRRAGGLLEIAVPLVFAGLTLGSVLLDHRLPLGRIGMLYAAVTGFQCCRHFEGLISGRRLAIDAGLFVVVMAAGNAVAFGHFHHPTITMAQAMGPWFIASALFFAVYGWRRLREAALFSNPVLAGLGAISFSTYLLHPFAIGIAARAGPGLAMDAVAVGLTVILSIAGYRLVERPGMALGKRLAARAERR